MEDPIQIGMFAHAANGGVWIAPDTSTGVPGLFAAERSQGACTGPTALAAFQRPTAWCSVVKPAVQRLLHAPQYRNRPRPASLKL